MQPQTFFPLDLKRPCKLEFMLRRKRSAFSLGANLKNSKLDREDLCIPPTLPALFPLKLVYPSLSPPIRLAANAYRVKVRHPGLPGESGSPGRHCARLRQRAEAGLGFWGCLGAPPPPSLGCSGKATVGCSSGERKSS